jgi:hypothetical protein
MRKNNKNNKKFIFLLVIVIISVVIVFIVKKKRGLTVEKLCSAYIKFADRARKNETYKSFEDYIYLNDNNERMTQCELSMRNVYSINGKIKDEPEEKQKSLYKMYKCMNSKNLEEYTKCFRN